MKDTSRLAGYVFTGVIALIMAFGIVLPNRAQAFEWGRIVDPLCLFACDGEPEVEQLVDPLCVWACDENEENFTQEIPNPTVAINANPLSVNYGWSSALSWNSSDATYCFASGGVNGWSGNKNISGTFYTGTLTNTTTFYITCSNSAASANNFVTVNVEQQIQTCQDSNATNYGGYLPCTYPPELCQDQSAINYRGTLPCRYQQICRDAYATNYHETLPCRYQNTHLTPTVSLRADDTNIDFEDETTLRWSSNDADYCRASGGDNGWSGNKNTSGSFNTGSLENTTTFRITCYNSDRSADDSITIHVEDEDDNDDTNEPDATTRNATNVRTNSATLNGRVDGNGSSVRAWFEYGTNYNLGYSTSRNSYGSQSRNFDRSISGLLPNTTYYFRAIAENSRDIVYGNILSFNTSGDFVNTTNNQPTVVISADSLNIAFNSATNIRWFTNSATSCFASGGSLGWAGTKNIGPGSFYTGVLTSSKTYTITCSNNFGSSTDSITINVRGQIVTTTIKSVKPALTSLVLITSSIDRNQPITSTLDNTRPRPGDEISYSVSYQNVGTGAISDVTLRVELPSEVDYLFSNKNILTRLGQSFIFDLGTLKANSQDTVTIRVKVQNDIIAGTNLNFPATLTYIDPAGSPQSVTTYVSAQVLKETEIENGEIPIQANILGAGFLPTNLFGWLFLFILVLILVLLAKYLFDTKDSRLTLHADK